MNNRYLNIKEVKNEDGKRVTSSTLYPPIARSINDIYVITSVGDRLDLLAHKYYGKVSYYWIIAEANGVGKGTLVLEGGIQLRIPMDVDTVIEDYKNLNR